MFIAAIMLMTLMPAAVFADDMPPIEPAGQSGKWTYTYQAGTLTITGNGKMTDFCGNEDMGVTGAPWRDYSKDVTTLIIGDDVKSIGWYAFINFTKLSTVYIGKGVTEINDFAFYGCKSLKTVNWAWKKTDNFPEIHIASDGNNYFNNATWNWGAPYSASYTVHFDANGGTGTMKNQSIACGKSVKLTANAFKRTGYAFNGWSFKKNGDGVRYKDKEAVTDLSIAGKTITLYAQWKKASYTVKFNANGGKGTMKDLSCSRDKSVTLTANAFTRTNFTFSGWNTKKDGSGTAYKNKASVKNLASSGKSITLYAQWKLKKGCYKINYKLNSGTNSSSNPDSYASGKAVTLKNPTRKGYTFAGWYKDSKFKTKVTKISASSTGTVTLYAKWTANKYTVKFNANGGTGSMSSKTYTYAKSYTLPANSFKKTNYTFNGWNTKKDGSGTAYKNKASVKNLSSKSKGTVTLYAQWKSKEDKLIADINMILRRTGEPAYNWHNNKKVSYKVDSAGKNLWACQTTANGALGFITAYDNGKAISATYCRWNEPYLTMKDKTDTTDAYNYRLALADGTYDFKNDPAKVIIGWAMYTSDTKKADFQKMINNKISDKVFDEVLLKYNGRTVMSFGGSCIIVYGKDANGNLIGRYAGSVYYNNAANATQYYLVGIDPNNTADYGKVISNTLLY